MPSFKKPDNSFTENIYLPYKPVIKEPKQITVKASTEKNVGYVPPKREIISPERVEPIEKEIISPTDTTE